MIVMDIAPGHSFFHCLYSKGNKNPYTQKERLQRAIELVKTIESLHKKNIYHLDLNSANIHIDEAGRCHLIDFGIAEKLDKNQNLRNKFPYIPGYFAPERHSEANPSKADIYSTGVLLAQLLGNTPTNSIERQRHSENKMSNEEMINNFVSQCTIENRQLKQLITRMLNIDPQQRPDWKQISNTLQAQLASYNRKRRATTDENDDQRMANPLKKQRFNAH